MISLRQAISATRQVDSLVVGSARTDNMLYLLLQHKGKINSLAGDDA